MTEGQQRRAGFAHKAWTLLRKKRDESGTRKGSPFGNTLDERKKVGGVGGGGRGGRSVLSVRGLGRGRGSDLRSVSSPVGEEKKKRRGPGGRVSTQKKRCQPAGLVVIFWKCPISQPLNEKNLGGGRGKEKTSKRLRWRRPPRALRKEKS